MESKAEDVKILKDFSFKRSTIKGRLTRFKNHLDMIQGQEDLSDLEVRKLEMKLSRAEILHKEFDELQAQMESLRAPSVDIELQSTVQNRISITISLLPSQC